MLTVAPSFPTESGAAAVKRGYATHQAKSKALGKKRIRDTKSNAHVAATARSTFAENELHKRLRTAIKSGAPTSTSPSTTTTTTTDGRRVTTTTTTTAARAA